MKIAKFGALVSFFVFSFLQSVAFASQQPFIEIWSVTSANGVEHITTRVGQESGDPVTKGYYPNGLWEDDTDRVAANGVLLQRWDVTQQQALDATTARSSWEIGRVYIVVGSNCGDAANWVADGAGVNRTVNYGSYAVNESVGNWMLAIYNFFDFSSARTVDDLYTQTWTWYDNVADWVGDFASTVAYGISSFVSWVVNGIEAVWEWLFD